MNNITGSNSRGIKIKNQSLVLKLIATTENLSRVDIAKITRLSKMTVGNIVSELMESVIEESDEIQESGTQGRNPIGLRLKKNAPCICGILIERSFLKIIAGDLSGKIIEETKIALSSELKAHDFLDVVCTAVTQFMRQSGQRFFAAGISCIGPVNSVEGVICNPPNFYDLQNVHIVEVMEKLIRLPVFLLNDSNAGALAVKLYGQGKKISSFLYLHLKSGIGCGLILENVLFNGDRGQSGEIGHSTINFAGPKCSCGNTGCLELYANEKTLKNHMKKMYPFFPDSQLFSVANLNLASFIDCAHKNDKLAISALTEYCTYLAYAIANALNLLDISHIFLDYENSYNSDVLCVLLKNELKSLVLSNKVANLSISVSGFNGLAPLIGSTAFVADMVFNGSLQVPVFK